jgi:hypothetical protein
MASLIGTCPGVGVGGGGVTGAGAGAEGCGAGADGAGCEGCGVSSIMMFLFQIDRFEWTREYHKNRVSDRLARWP